jgi:hypothetical protein
MLRPSGQVQQGAGTIARETKRDAGRARAPSLKGIGELKLGKVKVFVRDVRPHKGELLGKGKSTHKCLLWR